MFSSNAKTNSHWSLAGKLVTLYIVTASSSLMVASGFLYWTLVSNIDHEHRQLLSSELTELQSVLQQSPLNLKLLKQQVREESKHTTDAHTASFHPSAAHYSYFRVLDSQQQPVVETKNMSTLFPVTVFPQLTKTGIFTPTVKFQTADGRKFLLITQFLTKSDEIAGSWQVQAALNITQDEVILLQYQKMLGLVVIIGICFSTIAGFWIAKKGLKPLNKITRSVQAITVNRLHDTISSEKWPKELSLLAMAFDEMLGRLDESFARMSQFSADLAHELRTPINNLMGETEVSLSRPRTASEYQQILESNMEEFGRLSRMIDELLFLSRAEAPDSKINLKKIVFENKIRKICSFYESMAAEKKITFHIEGHAKAFVDPVLLQRALNNIIANAISYSDMGANIYLLAKQDHNFTEIHVCDSGIGIDSKDLPKIFDRFYRADKARVKDTQGTGLGLSLVKSIMDLHHGTVTVHSKIGKGTTAILRFPSNPPQR